ncbi:MAG: hypothetical protein ACOH17_09155 [Cellulomonas sp.]
MAVPRLSTLIKAYPWPVLVVGTVVSVAASLVRDLIHQEGTIRAGEGVAIAVTLAAGICAIWALVVIALRRRRLDKAG